LGGVADVHFAYGGHQSVLDAWVGTLAFTGQIYGDFSGYTDIAIGVALLLGFRLPKNFNLPYLAISPMDFWRRWHISLSTWLRDYVYIPLGGSRRNHYRNLIVTMLLGGIWHGANWTFILWGLYHGLLLALTHGWMASSRLNRFGQLIPNPFKIALTFYFVSLGWVLFRSPTIQQAISVILDMHSNFVPSYFDQGHLMTVILVISGLVGCHLISSITEWFHLQKQDVLHPSLVWTYIFSALFFAYILSNNNQPFIYFQF